MASTSATEALNEQSHTHDDEDDRDRDQHRRHRQLLMGAASRWKQSRKHQCHRELAVVMRYGRLMMPGGYPFSDDLPGAR